MTIYNTIGIKPKNADIRTPKNNISANSHKIGTSIKQLVTP